MSRPRVQGRPRARSRGTTRPRSTWRSPQHERVARTAACRVARRVRSRAVAASTGIATPTAPPPTLRGRHRRPARVAPDQVFAANGSNEVLQTLLLAYGGAGATACDVRADLPAALATSPASPATAVVERRAHVRLRSSTSMSRSRRSRDARPAITFLCSPNNPTGMVETEATVRAVASPGRPGWSWWTRRTASSRRGRRRRSWTRTSRWSSPARSPRRGRWRPPGSATSSGPSWLVAELEKVVLPYHLDTAKQIAGVLALDVRRRDGGSRRPRRRRARAHRRGAASICGVARVAVGRELRAVPVRRSAGASATRSGRGCSTDRARPRLLVVAPPRRLPAGHGRHRRTRTIASSTALAEVLA